MSRFATPETLSLRAHHPKAVEYFEHQERCCAAVKPICQVSECRQPQAEAEARGQQDMEKTQTPEVIVALGVVKGNGIMVAHGTIGRKKGLGK